MPDDIDDKIETAVFKLMETTDIPDIRVADVIKLAKVSRSTFYRHFDSVDDVVKRFESELLQKTCGASTTWRSRHGLESRSLTPRSPW